jgi:hypothetical protein
MNVRWYRTRNWFRKVYVRIIHPWPFYKRVGGINAVVHRADGTVEDLKNVSPVYGKRWGTGASP